MSMDIFFGPGRNWNVRSGVFCDLIARARKHCGDAPAIAEELAVAEASGVLGMPDRHQQMRAQLARCLRAGATEWLDELRVNPLANVNEPIAETVHIIKLLERLLGLLDEELKSE